MYELFLALFLAFSCPAQTDNSGQHHRNTTVATANTSGTDSGGDTEHIPPHPKP